jgi:hypothetical protein
LFSSLLLFPSSSHLHEHPKDGIQFPEASGEFNKVPSLLDTVDFVPKDLDTGKEEGGRKKEKEGGARRTVDGGKRK